MKRYIPAVFVALMFLTGCPQQQETNAPPLNDSDLFTIQRDTGENSFVTMQMPLISLKGYLDDGSEPIEPPVDPPVDPPIDPPNGYKSLFNLDADDYALGTYPFGASNTLTVDLGGEKWFETSIYKDDADRTANAVTSSGGNLWWGSQTTVDGERPQMGDIIRIGATYFFPSGFDYRSNSSVGVKFLRIGRERLSDGAGVGYTELHIKANSDGTPSKWVFTGEAINRDGSKTSPVIDIDPAVVPPPAYDVPIKVELRIRLDSIPVDDGGLAWWELWINNKLATRLTRIATAGIVPETISQGIWHNYWNGGSHGPGAPATQSLFYNRLFFGYEN